MVTRNNAKGIWRRASTKAVASTTAGWFISTAQNSENGARRKHVQKGKGVAKAQVRRPGDASKTARSN